MTRDPEAGAPEQGSPGAGSAATGPLARFSAPTRAWFGSAFAAPTPAQAEAWQAISGGQDALVVAPTGSGKTLAAFLWALDTLHRQEAKQGRCRVLYVSPLKALAVDVERNLRSPLTGIRQQALLQDVALHEVEVGMRTGDTTAQERRRFPRHPPDILITTPESLFLLLTSAAREALTHVETVILDEVHAVAGTKRGAHLAVSLERLDQRLTRPAQRIGLSATVRPVQTVAAFLSGARPVTVVQPESQKTFDLRVEVPVTDMGALSAAARPEQPATAPAPAPAAPSIWPHVEERVLELVTEHTSTLVFANSRRLAERLTTRLNEAAAERAELLQPPDEQSEVPTTPPAGTSVVRPPSDMVSFSGSSRPTAAGSVVDATTGPPVLARAHHGSVSREQRKTIEEALKTGALPAVVATSSLELGIDMGAVDLVVQVESPPSVASGLQRVGRAGHQVGAVSEGVLFPKHRGDLLSAAVVVQRMRDGEIEALRVPKNPLDVLAQQIVAMTAMDDWAVEELLAVLRRALPFAELPQSVYDAVLDMLSGRYPSDEFAELRPRLVWDRVSGVLTGRPGAQRLAVTSGGTIPDRGLFGVFLLGEGGSRVGELDEEMVYESRVGDVFALGTTSWRIEDITHDRVLVSPAPGQPARLPFWHGDTLGRPAELGQAQGSFVRQVAGLADEAALQQVAAAGLDRAAAENLVRYLREQQEAVGELPDDRTIVVERFRDELGDWRMVVHSPYGAAVHAPWALAVGARLQERFGVDVAAAHADDGMIFRIPDTVELEDPGSSADEPLAELVRLDSDSVETLVTDAVGGSALFAARFRECAGRALLLPRRDPGRRTPLWQQRMRSAQLLEVAAKHPTFPIVLETMRECLQDVYDLQALVDLLKRIESREVRVVEVQTEQPSPFARSLLFGYIGSFMYEGDAPLAERRAQALTLDATLLAELLGRAELRELLDPDVIATTEVNLQRLAEGRRARATEQVADLLRELGPLTTAEIDQRCVDQVDVATALDELQRARRVIRVRVAGQPHWAGIEDAGRLRDALGAALPVGVPEAFLEPVADPLGDLVSRYARVHGPFPARQAAQRLGLGEAVVGIALRRLAVAGRVTEGEFRPGESGTEWCDADVLRLLRRRSVAALRSEAAPVEKSVLGRFLPEWQHVGSSSRGPDGVLDAVTQLAGYPIPASTLETLVLPARVKDYQPAWLDELTVAGEVIWSGRGSLGGSDGWVTLHLTDQVDLTLSQEETALIQPDRAEPGTSHAGLAEALLALLDDGGALFFRQLVDELSDDPTIGQDDTAQLSRVLWELVWSGHVTNDTLAPVRARSGVRSVRRVNQRRRSPRARGGRRGGLGGAGERGRRRGVQLAPDLTGRWSRLPAPETDVTVRAHATADLLLDRYGVLTRGAVAAEAVPGGFAAVYRTLSAAEEAGRCRRGYLVEGLGGAQFAQAATIDRLRRLAEPGQGDAGPLILAATDPANPFGAALDWPAHPHDGGHRPGRRAGAVVVLISGRLALFVERGGRSILTFTSEPEALSAGANALAEATRAGRLGRLRVQRVDGRPAGPTVLGTALRDAGFHPVPNGLHLAPGLH